MPTTPAGNELLALHVPAPFVLALKPRLDADAQPSPAGDGGAAVNVQMRTSAFGLQPARLKTKRK